MLIVFDYMIANMLSNKTLNLTVTELITRGRKLILLSQKNVRLNFMDYFIMKFRNKQEF